MKLDNLIARLKELQDEGHGNKEVWFTTPRQGELFLVEAVHLDNDGEVELS